MVEYWEPFRIDRPQPFTRALRQRHERPRCEACGSHYIIDKRYVRTKLKDGGLLVELADLRDSYGRRETDTLHISARELAEDGIQGFSDIKRQEFSTEDAIYLLRRLVRDRKDVNDRWRVLRTFCMIQFRHAQPLLSDQCKLIIHPDIPRTFYKWIGPLCLILRGLGLSGREISRRIPVFTEEQAMNVHESVSHAIDELQDPEVDAIHRRNRATRPRCELRNRGEYWSVELANGVDKETWNWLEGVSERHGLNIRPVAPEALPKLVDQFRAEEDHR